MRGSEVVHWERKRLGEKREVSCLPISHRISLLVEFRNQTLAPLLLLPRIHAMTDDGLWNHRWKGRKGQWKERKRRLVRDGKMRVYYESTRETVVLTHLSWTDLNRLRKGWFPMVISSLKRTLTDERKNQSLLLSSHSSANSLTSSFHSEQQKRC